MPNEDPCLHIKEFYSIIGALPLKETTKEYLRMHLFPFSLKDKAKNWLLSLPQGTLTSWEQISKKFLQKYFPMQKTANLWSQICTFSQLEGELLHESYECYKELLLRCPHHGLNLYLQL